MKYFSCSCYQMAGCLKRYSSSPSRSLSSCGSHTCSVHFTRGRLFPHQEVVQDEQGISDSPCSCGRPQTWVPEWLGRGLSRISSMTSSSSSWSSSSSSSSSSSMLVVVVVVVGRVGVPGPPDPGVVVEAVRAHPEQMCQAALCLPPQHPQATPHR